MKFGDIITSSENRGSKKDFEQVTLDDNLLIFRSITIQIQNISRLTSYKIKRTCKYKLFLILLNIPWQYLTVIALSEVKKSGLIDLGFGLHIHIGYFLIVSCILLFLLMEALFYKRYGVQIQTNGYTIDQLETNDIETADELCMRLIVLIKKSNKNEITAPTSLYKNCKVVEGDHILGDKISDIENSYIQSYSENREKKMNKL